MPVLQYDPYQEPRRVLDVLGGNGEQQDADQSEQQQRDGSDGKGGKLSHEAKVRLSASGNTRLHSATSGRRRRRRGGTFAPLHLLASCPAADILKSDSDERSKSGAASHQQEAEPRIPEPVVQQCLYPAGAALHSAAAAGRSLGAAPSCSLQRN